MNVCVLGAGSIGRRHLKGISLLRETLGVNLITTYDTNPDRLDIVRSDIKGVECKDSLKDAVKNIDVVFVCVPTALHMPVYEEISKYGRFHLFFEKPLSHSIEGCEKMLFDQKLNGKFVALGYMLHHHPVIKRMREIVTEGTLGRILSVRAEAGFYLPQWHPWEDYRDFYMSWKVGGGGALLDLSHEINYLQWIFGDIDEVQGTMGTVSDLEISSDDLAVAIVKFSNSIIGQIQLDLLQFEESRFCKVIGTEGVLIADLNSNSVKFNTKDNHTWNEEKIELDFDKIYHVEYENVFKVFNGDQGYIVSGDSAYKTMEVIEAIRRSHSSGLRIKLPMYN